MLGVVEAAAKDGDRMKALVKSLDGVVAGGVEKALCAPIRRLLEEVKTKEGEAKIFKDFINDSRIVESCLKFSNAITADSLNTLQVLAEVFEMQILVYKKSVPVPESYTPNLSSKHITLQFYLALQWDESEDSCLLLYKDDVCDSADKIVKRLAGNLLRAKMSEVELMMALTSKQSGKGKETPRYCIKEETLKELKEDCKALKDLNSENYKLSQLEKLITLIKDKDRIDKAIEDLMGKKQTRMAISEKETRCLICFKPSKEHLVFNCTHRACHNCLKTQLAKRCNGDLVLRCIFPGCQHVLGQAEQAYIIEKDLMKLDFLEQVKGDNAKCGMCDKSSLKVSLTFLHESHGLCKECLKVYVEETTQGRVYVYANGIGVLKNYPCPFKGCNKQFGYELISELYTFEENQELLKISRKEFAMVS